MNDGMESATMAPPQIIELSELTSSASPGESIFSGSLDVVQAVKTKLTVVVGDATVSIGDLLNMKANQIFKLDRMIDDHVDILLEGNVVARGQLVAVDDHFGVRITELPKAKNA
ncbi:MAG TPA: FliM/FliN family flagellar motor switch protein [Paucimonas sp.]|nr:FliM/FliN family flagellar motor switch protein [Paucimonas sp.]